MAESKASTKPPEWWPMQPEDTAVVIMDYQKAVVNGIVGDESKASALLGRANAVLAAARAHGLPVMHVVAQLRPGLCDVSEDNKAFAMFRKHPIFLDPSAMQIHEGVHRQEDEPVIVKRRFSALFNSDLLTILSAKHTKHLVLLGISTSGVVLSTLRYAADLDYRITVVSDCCADSDAEVHRVLMEKVFPWQANITTADDFIKHLKK